MDDKKLVELLPQAEEDVPAMALKAAAFIRAARELVKENEMLRAQLAASERQRAAAVADLEALMEKTQSAEACYICANDHDHTVCGSNFTRCVPKWRGPQEAGEGGG